MPKTDTDAVTFSISQVARALGVSETSVRRSIADLSMPAIRLRGRVLVLAQPLCDLILRATGDPTIAAEDAAQAVAQAAEDKLQVVIQAKVRAEAVAMRESHDKAGAAAYSADPQIRYA